MTNDIELIRQAARTMLTAKAREDGFSEEQQTRICAALKDLLWEAVINVDEDGPVVNVRRRLEALTGIEKMVADEGVADAL